MIGRVLILALCVFSAYSLPAPKTAISDVSLTPDQIDSIVNQIEGIVNIHSAKSLSDDTGVINWPVVAGVLKRIGGIVASVQARTSLTESQIDSILNIANKIEGIINIHSARTPLDVAQIEDIIDILNKIEGILHIHSLPAAPGATSAMTPSETDNILDQIEGIVRMHFDKSISDTGVINWPVVESVADKISSILGSLTARTSLTQSQIDSIINTANQIEGIINIHSSQTRASLDAAEVEKIIDILNKIEGIINIHSAPDAPEAKSSLTPTQIDNILNQIEGIVNIHIAKSISDTGVINWPVVESVADKIGSILGSLRARTSLTQSQIDSIINIANQIEGIINIHSSQTRASLDASEAEKIIDILNKIEGIINIHSSPDTPEAKSSLTPTQIANILNQIEGIVNIHIAKSISDTGVINWPVVESVADKIASIVGSLKARTSLTPTEIENILNKIEDIVHIHSQEIAPQPQLSEGVINVTVVVDAINQIKGILSLPAARTSLTPEEIENIVNVINKIEGIVHIH